MGYRGVVVSQICLENKCGNIHYRMNGMKIFLYYFDA